MIDYKGNECFRCKLHIKNTIPDVFEFHHIDPNSKDPNFDRLRNNNLDKIKPELDKCILVCANCHRTIHYEINKTVLSSLVEQHSDKDVLKQLPKELNRF